jgi:TonB-dependent receptor
VKTFRNRAIAIRGATSMIALVTGLAFAPAAIAQTAPATPSPATQAPTAEAAQVPTDTTGSQAVDPAPQTVSTVPDPAAATSLDQVNNPEDIIVTGTRASLQSAIARKKNAGTVVDSIVADDIASFPDKNVGEALGRITGVQLSRTFGEGNQVSIRGVEPELNRVEINGVSQQSALGVRGGDFRELAVELVKSIDVYKGYTVDLTEGGIGGTVSVETRRPLELKNPVFSVRAEAQHLDLTQNWKPRFNLTAGRGDYFDNRLGFIVNVTYSDVSTREDYASNTNWGRVADFDRSTSKTIANPTYASFATYDSCVGATGTTQALATSNRLACETQFFDWAPTVVRYRTLDRNDKRTTADFQLQFKVADNFSVWGQAQLNQRIQQLRDANYSVNSSSFDRFNFDGSYVQSGRQLGTNLFQGATRQRITPGTFTIDEATHTVTSWITQANGINSGTAASPGYQGANSILSVQRRDFDYNQLTQYYQTGFNWELGRMKAIGFGSYSKAKLINNTNLVAINTGVGSIQVDRRNDAGVPVLTFPSAFNPANPADYANLTRTGADGQRLLQQGPSVQYRPQDAGTSEKQLKLDVDYDTSDLLPFIRSIEYGGQYRASEYFSYLSGGSRLLRPAVTAVAAAGIPAQAAVYQTGANVSINTIITDTPPTTRAANTVYLTQAQYQQFIAQNTGVTGGAPLFTGLSVRPDGAPDRLAIPLFNYGNLSQYYDLSGFDQDLVRFADGLPQIPSYRITEDIVAGYLKFNFEQEFLGMRLTGNAGLRYTFTRDRGTSVNVRTDRRIAAGTGVTLPNGTVIPAVTETIVTSAQQITLQNEYHDWLPAANFNLEVKQNLFVRGTYAKNLARPKVSDLSPAINCTYDSLDTAGINDVCSAGNPALQPYRADQYDLNVSWYPNADTLVSLGYYYKDIKSFVLPVQTRSDVNLFNDGVLYTVRQPINGFGAKLDGFEASAQTVFTFLPQPFDGFGVSGNFTYARVLNNALTNVATGDPLNAYPGLSKFTYNASVFYDKDWVNIKFNYNRRTDWLQTAADSNNGNNPIFRRGETYIDGKVLFRITPRYNVWVEAQNLGKEFTKTYIDAARPIEYSYPGQRIFVGAQLKL